MKRLLKVNHDFFIGPIFIKGRYCIHDRLQFIDGRRVCICVTSLTRKGNLNSSAGLFIFFFVLLTIVVHTIVDYSRSLLTAVLSD